MRKKILVLGIGSPIMCDDAIGLRVLKELSNMGLDGVDLVEACTSGLDLIEIMLGYEKVIIVDAIMNSGNPPGSIIVLGTDAFSDSVHGTNPHEANVATTIELGKTLEPERFPKNIVFIAIEVIDIFTLSETMTPEIEAVLPKAITAVLEQIKQI